MKKSKSRKSRLVIVQWLCIIGFMYVMVEVAIADPSWIQAFINVDWKLLIIQVLSIPFIIFIINKLISIHPKIMNWGWLGKNIYLIALDVKYLGIAYGIILMAMMPFVAQFEERVFRGGTKNWLDAIWRSIAFGFAHMLVGLPVVSAILLTGFGFLYTYFYFQGGVARSAQAHFQYNLVFLTVLLINIVINTFKKEKSA